MNKPHWHSGHEHCLRITVWTCNFEFFDWKTEQTKRHVVVRILLTIDRNEQNWKNCDDNKTERHFFLKILIWENSRIKFIRQICRAQFAIWFSSKSGKRKNHPTVTRLIQVRQRLQEKLKMRNVVRYNKFEQQMLPTQSCDSTWSVLFVRETEYIPPDLFMPVRWEN